MNKKVVVLARQRHGSQKGSAILRRSGIPAKAAVVAGCSGALSI